MEKALPRRPFALMCVVLLAALAAPVVGSFTNLINGALCPGYFLRVMGWQDGPDLLGRIVAQGIFESVCFAIVLGTVFGVATAIITRARAPFLFGARHVAGAVAGVLACWVFGGLLCVGLAALSPSWWQARFPLSSGPSDFLQGAWVGGSIWGLYLGALPTVLLVLALMRTSWKDHVETESSQPAQF